MTVNDIITELNKIPARERCRPISLCGDAINCNSEETINEIEIDWIDCSDALVLLFNKVEAQRDERIHVSHNPCYSPFDDSPTIFYKCSCCGYEGKINETRRCFYYRNICRIRFNDLWLYIGNTLNRRIDL